MRAEILGKTGKKKIFTWLRDRFGFKGEIPYGFLKIQGRIKVLSRDFQNFTVKGLGIEDLGLLFAEWKGDRLMLTIEGSQIVGPEATKNVLELDAEQMVEWMTGGVLRSVEGLEEGAIILKHNRDFLGCGELSRGKIWSSIPPHRRIKGR
ncbi:MAG: hypothetical protein ACOC6G_00330 [Thermoproteota archaeon]